MSEKDDLQELVDRAGKAQAETQRLLAELARKQAELAAIQKRLADAGLRSAEVEVEALRRQTGE